MLQSFSTRHRLSSQRNIGQFGILAVDKKQTLAENQSTYLLFFLEFRKTSPGAPGLDVIDFVVA